MRRELHLTLPILAVALTPTFAFAQSSDAATAELLYQQGRELLKSGKAAEACPKLAESQRLDPATGTLLALAMCHEEEGKLASAWAEFVSAESRSRSEGRADREAFCRDRAAALQPRLSTLEIRVPGSVASQPGLEIRRDGVVFGSGAWNTAAPVDGGSHVVEVSAPGKSTWKASVSVRAEGDAQVLEVPELQEVPSSASSATTSSSTTPDTDSAQSRPFGTLEWAGIGTAGAGVIALGVGGYFLSSALSKNSDSEADCDGNVCGDQGTADRNSALSKGNTATWLGLVGGALVATGAVLFVVGRGQQPGDTALAVGAGPGGFGARVSTRF